MDAEEALRKRQERYRQELEEQIADQQRRRRRWGEGPVVSLSLGRTHNLECCVWLIPGLDPSLKPSPPALMRFIGFWSTSPCMLLRCNWRWWKVFFQKLFSFYIVLSWWINGKWIHVALWRPVATQGFTILASLTHTLIHRGWCRPCKVTTSSSGAGMVEYLAQGHLQPWLGGAGDWTGLPDNPEPLPPGVCLDIIQAMADLRAYLLERVTFRYVLLNMF